MRHVYFPKVSIITPTLNSQRTLKRSLASIVRQNYHGKFELVVADAGSTDETVDIAKSYGARIVQNRLKTGEAGKAAGAKFAKGEILAFIDSDNVLPDDRWLAQMVQPFLDSKGIVASEPLYFTYRKSDHWLTRYFALLGMGDPLNLFLGNYDRYSFITGRWTGLKVEFVNKGKYVVLSLRKYFPTIGANGFLIRKKELKKYPIKNYLFDIDVLKFLAKDHPVNVAKVKVGIVHLFTGDIATFIRKQRRRIRDFFYFRNSGIRANNFNEFQILQGVIIFVIATVIVLPLLVQAFVGFIRKRDIAWLFHPLACWLTLIVYGFEALRTPFVHQQFDRKKWSQ